MIVTKRSPREFAEAGYTLVQATDVLFFEGWGVPLYMGRHAVQPGRASGPWAPGWAVTLIDNLGLRGPTGDLELEGTLKRVISAALRQDDPREFGEYAEGAVRLGGVRALEAILEGARP